MTIEIAQSTHYVLASAVSALRAQYAGVQAVINSEALTGTYSCPDLLTQNVAGTAWPNPSRRWVELGWLYGDDPGRSASLGPDRVEDCLPTADHLRVSGLQVYGQTWQVVWMIQTSQVRTSAGTQVA